MNKTFRTFLIVLGEALLIYILYLLIAAQPAQLAVHAVALTVVYLANVFGYPQVSRQPGEDAAAGYGLAWLFTWIYSGLTLLAAAVFIYSLTDIKWEVLVYALFLLGYLVGIYWSRVAAVHAGGVQSRLKAERSNLDLLMEKGRMLPSALPADADETLTATVRKVTELTAYLSPSDAVLSADLERQIDAAIDVLNSALLEHRPAAVLEEQASRCITLLKQRMALN